MKIERQLTQGFSLMRRMGLSGLATVTPTGGERATENVPAVMVPMKDKRTFRNGHTVRTNVHGIFLLAKNTLGVPVNIKNGDKVTYGGVEYQVASVTAANWDGGDPKYWSATISSGSEGF